MPRERNTFLFSATMSSKVESLQRASLREPVRISVKDTKYQTVKTLIQNYIFIPLKHKDTYLIWLLANEFPGQSAVIFTRTVNETQRLAILLRTLGLGAVPLHGQLSQTNRLGALNKFKAGNRDILVATDVAARGLDIPNVDVSSAPIIVSHLALPEIDTKHPDCDQLRFAGRQQDVRPQGRTYRACGQERSRNQHRDTGEALSTISELHVPGTATN